MFQCLNVKSGVVNPATPFCNKGEEEEEDRRRKHAGKALLICHVWTTKNIHIDNWTAVAFLL